MQQKDCIVVLGSGVSAEGNLTPIGKSRVEKAADCYKKRMAARILMCGKYSYKLQYIPKKTEAQAMKEYAMQLGIPDNHLFLEEQSRETIGNAYFAKRFLEARNWTSIIVITSNLYLPRTQFIFKKVFGKSFSIDIIPSLTYLSPEEIVQRMESEVLKLKSYREYDEIRDGDDRGVRAFLSRQPWYAQVLKTSLLF